MKIDLAFRIDTELLQLRFQADPSLTGRTEATLTRRLGHVTIHLAPGADWDSPERQRWLNDILAEQLRIQAKAILPARLDEMARRFDLRYHGVTIKRMHTRWGSCSELGNINLSLWLMLAPAHLVDYVIKHELAHLNEMNHGPRFWAELDRMTGGRARQLEREMKQFARSLFAQRGRLR